MLLFAYGTTLGLPTIAIPVLSAASQHKSDPYLHLTRSQISWFSKSNIQTMPGWFILINHVNQDSLSILSLVTSVVEWLEWGVHLSVIRVTQIWISVAVESKNRLSSWLPVGLNQKHLIIWIIFCYLMCAKISINLYAIASKSVSG